MKKTTLALLMALPFTSVAANWEVKPIVTTIEDRQVPVAIMLYTNSTMTQGQDSTPLQMRMVCNINKDKIVGFVWNNSPNTKVINSSITVDGRALKNSIK